VEPVKQRYALFLNVPVPVPVPEHATRHRAPDGTGARELPRGNQPSAEREERAGTGTGTGTFESAN